MKLNMFTRINIVTALMALALLTNPDVLRAQNSRGCAWPIEVSPEGFGNLLAPDDLARYWIIPFDTYDTMTIKGAYPKARYFSFTVYDTYSNKATKDAAGNLYDAQIAPDPGSNNPFVQPGARNGTYTVTIARNVASQGNTIGFSTAFAWVALRLYVADSDPTESGQALMGSVPLPSIAVTTNGTSQELQPCSPINKLPDLTAFTQDAFPTGFDIQGTEGTPSSDRLWFAAPTTPPPVLMPNPNNKYMVMFPGDQYQPGRVIVIRGKAPGFPGTFGGWPIWVPSWDSRTVDVRYWSVCNTDLALPVSDVGCASDLSTRLDDGYYTIVISDDLLRPAWVKDDATWLRWGDEQYPKLVFFRNMLPSPNFHYAIQNAIAPPYSCTFDFDFPTLPERGVVDTKGQCAQQVMKDYYPVAAWCDKSTYIAGGARACLE